jgi:flagellar basal-body rod modification protein FlgD
VINSISGAPVGASASKQSLMKSAIGDRDTWIKLLVAQMTKGQDPMNPMNPDQMAAQLAQFSSVEQLMNISEQLDAMAGANGQMLEALGNTSAVATLGKTVVAIGDRVRIPEGGQASVQAQIGASGGQATVRIHDDSGRIIAQRELGAVRPGMQSFDLDLSAEALPPGSYRYSIEVVDTAGNVVPVQTYARARVEGIRQGQNGPVLIAGGMEIPLIHVIEVAN